MNSVSGRAILSYCLYQWANRFCAIFADNFCLCYSLRFFQLCLSPQCSVVHAPALCLLKNASSPKHLDPSWHLRPLDTESMASTIRQTWRFSGQIVGHLSQFQNRTCLCQLFKWGGTKNSEGIPPPILYFPLMIGRNAQAMAKYENSLMTSKNKAWELTQII